MGSLAGAGGRSSRPRNPNQGAPVDPAKRRKVKPPPPPDPRLPFMHYDLFARGVNPEGETLQHLVQQRRLGQIDDALKGLEDAGYSKTQQNVYAIFSQALLWFGELGRQSFVIPPSVQEAFLRTDIDPELANLVEMPYPVFYVALPSNRLHITINAPGELSRRAALAGFYVCNYASMGGDEEGTMLVTVNTTGDAGVTVVPKDLAAVLQHLKGDPYKAEWVNAALLQLLMNFCLYLSSGGGCYVDGDEAKRRKALLQKAARAGPGKRKKLKRQADRLSSTVITWIGEKSSGSDTTPPQDGGSVREHWVRGHWRNQPCGYMRLERRLMWIQPHKRGKDNPFTSRTYRLPQ